MGGIPPIFDALGRVLPKNKKYKSTPQFSPIGTHRQRSTSATSNSSDDSPLFPKIKKHSSRSMTNRKKEVLSSGNNYYFIKIKQTRIFQRIYELF